MRGCRYDAGSRLPIAPPPEKPPIVRAETSDAYVELAVRSNFSFLRGGSSPEAIARRAAELGYAAIALTDFAGLYGAVRAMVECEASNVRLVLGCEVPFSEDGEEGVLLHVENHAGYTNLCALLSAAHLRGPKLTKNDHAFATTEEIARLAGGLFCTAPSLGMESKSLGALRDAFGERFSLGTFRHLDGEDASRERAVLARARELNAPIVAHNAVRFAIPDHKMVLDVLHCIRRGITLDEAGRELLPNTEARIASPNEMVARFSDHPEWIARTRDIASESKFSLRELNYKFPCEVPAGDTPDAMLRRMTYEGAKNRYGEKIPESVTVAIEKELALIAKLEVATYFLSVRAIVDIAKDRDILCQGRGSAANSAVCFCLGITAVDPARASLLFERFLSIERKEPPDIDVDFEHERREEVIQEIYSKYGRERAAMVSEVICYRGKSALREVGKVFGFSLEQVDRLASIVTWWDALDAKAMKRLRDEGFDASDPRVRHCLRMAAAIQGYPRHLSIHVGGFILSAEPLHRIAPVEPGAMKDRTVVPWDKDDIDELKFFKMDVLGLGMLTAIRKALDLSRSNTDKIFVNDLLAQIPAEDPAVYEALCRADSVGVFQIESRAQMAMLPRLLPKRFYDLVIEVAIVRPGPIQGGMVHPYLRRRNGEEAIDMPHEILRPILERTLGVPLFQEQVMQIAIVGAGYSGGEADQLRRDMAAWKRNGKLARHRERLRQGFSERGISDEFSERLYKQIQGFGEYGFPESHAASFALLVYASAWLKVHHPAAFAAALINSQPMGFYSANTILQDAVRHGVELLPIRVEYSDYDCTLEPPAIRVGLRLVKGLGEDAGRRVEKARREHAFESVEDLRARADLDRKEMDALAEAGALNGLVANGSARDAMWSVRASRGEGLFRGIGHGDDSISLPALTRTEQLVLDFERTGISVGDHPMRAMRSQLQKHVQSSAELAKAPHGQRVTTAGLVICRQRPGTASGIVFVTLEDEFGFVNLVLWAKVFERLRRVATSSGLLLVHGRVDAFAKRRDDGSSDVVYVIVDHLEKLRLARDLPSMSRDFH